MFDSRSASVAGVASGASRRCSTRRQITDLKIVAHRDAISDETPVGVKASLMRAYVDLQEMEMALRGYGRPKPVEARNAHTQKRKPRASGPVAPPKQEPPAEPPTA